MLLAHSNARHLSPTLGSFTPPPYSLRGGDGCSSNGGIYRMANLETRFFFCRLIIIFCHDSSADLFTPWLWPCPWLPHLLCAAVKTFLLLAISSSCQLTYLCVYLCWGKQHSPVVMIRCNNISLCTFFATCHRPSWSWGLSTRSAEATALARLPLEPAV